MKKNIAVIVIALFVSPCYGSEKRLDDIEARIETLEFAPRTAEDDMVAALDRMGLISIGNKIVEEIGEIKRTAIETSLRLKQSNENIEGLTKRSEENYLKNKEQDIDIKKNSEEILAVRNEAKITEAERRGQYMAISTGILISIFGGIFGGIGFLWRKKMIEKMLQKKELGAIKTEPIR